MRIYMMVENFLDTQCEPHLLHTQLTISSTHVVPLEVFFLYHNTETPRVLLEISYLIRVLI